MSNGHLPEAEREPVPPSVVRAWARANNIPVGARGHMPKAVFDAFNRAHRQVRAADPNPWRKKGK